MHAPSPSASDAAAAQPVASADAVRLARRTRALAVGCLLALIALGLAWELWLAPLRPGGSWWALKVLPLTLPLSGLLRHRMVTYRWLSLLVWLYFTEGVVRATTEAGLSAALAWTQVVLCLGLFTASALHVRLRLRYARLRTAAASEATAPGVPPTNGPSRPPTPATRATADRCVP
ncbi:DUF2069 domain-containing protein [Tepidimonas sp.]|uniref:DUF2069 domain-containing protein n=1 Tax=Tepidimonas sp. TaxID=2002775 RepID=UPI002FE14785